MDKRKTVSDWDKFVGPVCDAFDRIRELDQPDRRQRLWWIAKEALYQLGVGEGFISENDHVEPAEVESARLSVDLQNTKERLIYHVVRLVAEAADNAAWTDAADDANDMLCELGYASEARRTFMATSEPGLAARWLCSVCKETSMAGSVCVHCGERRETAKG